MNFCVICMACQEHQVLLDNSYMYRRNILLLKTGKYCCIWCLVTSDQLRDPPQGVPARSTQSICQDFQRFTAAGADEEGETVQ